jgi:hypothetical protein
MSAAFTKESEDLFVVSVEGTLTFSDLKEIEKNVITAIDRSQKIKVLILAEEFSGWGKEGDWGDVTFFSEYDKHIEKIAVVANDKWKDELLIFLGAGLRQAAVEIFPDDGEKDARNWLQN